MTACRMVKAGEPEQWRFHHQHTKAAGTYVARPNTPPPRSFFLLPRPLAAPTARPPPVGRVGASTLRVRNGQAAAPVAKQAENQTLSSAVSVRRVWAVPAPPQRQLLISGMSSPYCAMYC